MTAMPRAFQIHPDDNVATLIEDAAPGPIACYAAAALTAVEAIARGHKIALRAIAPGDSILKFGTPIGHATQAIQPGAWVHLHNIASDVDARSATLTVNRDTPTEPRSAHA